MYRSTGSGGESHISLAARSSINVTLQKCPMCARLNRMEDLGHLDGGFWKKFLPQVQSYLSVDKEFYILCVMDG